MKLEVIPINQDLNWIADTYPIVPAKQAPPAWWKTIKRDSNYESLANSGNIKTCPAIRDIINYGYIMPSWSWLEFTRTEDDILWQIGQGPLPTALDGHSQYQIEGSPVTPLVGGGAFKLVSPWQFKTPPGWGVIFNDPFWHYEDRPIKFLSGLVRTDAYGQVNFPFEINRPMEVGEVLQVTEGTPLIHISVVPIDDTFELDVVKATEQTDQIFRDEAASVIATSRLYYDKAVKEFDNDRSTR